MSRKSTPLMDAVDAPIEAVSTTLNFVTLMVETQAVMAYRMLGMAGLWSVTPKEGNRMMAEKAPAFTEAAVAAGQAALTGHRPDQVLAAAIAPLRRKTRANTRRLSKRGLKQI